MINLDFITWLVMSLLGVIQVLVGIILTPLGLIIKTLIPSSEFVFDSIASFFDYAMTYIGWIIDALAIPSILLNYIILAFLFKIGLTSSIAGFKIGLKWYNRMKA